MKEGNEWVCDFCGAYIEDYASSYHRGAEPESCGAKECDRYQRDCFEAEREDAHEELDRMMGW